jgi:hypothetical protein
MVRTSYTPTLSTGGARQPVLGDGRISGWHDGQAIHVELTVGQSTDLGEGPLQIGMPYVVDGVNATVTATVTAGDVQGWAALRDDTAAAYIVIADRIPLPLTGAAGLLWTGERLAPGDVLVLDGQCRAAPATCPDCHVATGALHTGGCGVAFCKACGYGAATCAHAGVWPVGLTLWRGHPPEQDSYEFGYSDRAAVLAAAQAGALVWQPGRERWEPPPPDVTIDDYEFVVEQDATGRYSVRLPGGQIAWAQDKAKAIADLGRFIEQAQAALAQLQNLP